MRALLNETPRLHAETGDFMSFDIANPDGLAQRFKDHCIASCTMHTAPMAGVGAEVIAAAVFLADDMSICLAVYCGEQPSFEVARSLHELAASSGVNELVTEGVATHVARAVLHEVGLTFDAVGIDEYAYHRALTVARARPAATTPAKAGV